MKKYKLGDKLVYISRYNFLGDLLAYILTMLFLFGTSYINIVYFGGAWYVGLFIVIFTIMFTTKLVLEKEITYTELMDFIDGNEVRKE